MRTKQRYAMRTNKNVTLPKWKLDVLASIGFIAGVFFGIMLSQIQSVRQGHADWVNSQYRMDAGVGYEFLSPVPSESLSEATPSGKTINNVVEYTQIALKHLPKYYPEVREQSKIMPVFSCLLRNEAGHGMNKSCGDGGRACGVVQFHEPTYIRNRRDMMKKGLAEYMGSRMDPDNAIETMIYMFSIGQGNQWGPFFREECI